MSVYGRAHRPVVPGAMECRRHRQRNPFQCEVATLASSSGPSSVQSLDLYPPRLAGPCTICGQICRGSLEHRPCTALPRGPRAYGQRSCVPELRALPDHLGLGFPTRSSTCCLLLPACGCGWCQQRYVPRFIMRWTLRLVSHGIIILGHLVPCRTRDSEHSSSRMMQVNIHPHNDRTPERSRPPWRCGK